MQLANFFNINCDIPELKGDNYKVWNERILLHLGYIKTSQLLLTPTLQPKRLFMKNGSD